MIFIDIFDKSIDMELDLLYIQLLLFSWMELAFSNATSFFL